MNLVDGSKFRFSSIIWIIQLYSIGHSTKKVFICQHCDAICVMMFSGFRAIRIADSSDKIMIGLKQERLGGAAAIMKINNTRQKI